MVAVAKSAYDALMAYGYFAQANRAPHVDLGPEWTPEQYEARQIYDRGLKAYLDLVRSPRPPFNPMGQLDPSYQSYYSAVRELQSLDPAMASELAQQSMIMGHMADLRRGRRIFMKPPPLAQNPYIALPVPPGYEAGEAATIGFPLYYYY